MRRFTLPLAMLLAAVAVSPRAAEQGGADRLVRPLAGANSYAFVQPEQTLHDIAFEHRLGFEAVSRLNPDLDPWLPPLGATVHLPTRYVLPLAEPEGLVINLPEMRLYDFTDPERPRVLAVAIGDPEDPTPTGDFRIGVKRDDPTWSVPDSIQQEKPWLPDWVPPGPENPLGSRWMTLGTSPYGIHGTNVRWSIGRFATHGCVRLYDDQMQELFDRVPSGTRVQIVYQPYKWGTDGRRLFLEAHPDPYARKPDRLAEALAVPRQLGALRSLDLEKVWSIVERQLGVPKYAGPLPLDHPSHAGARAPAS